MTHSPEQADAEPRAPRRQRSDGIRTLDDFMGRCRIDEETGCWVWAGGVSDSGTPFTYIAAGALGPTSLRMNAARAGWLLAGKKLKAGKYLVRKPSCLEPLCCNAKHRFAGTRADVGRASSKRGGYNTAPRLALLHKACMKQALAAEVVQKVAELCAAGASARAAAEAVGIDPKTALRIKQGNHILQRPSELRAASVFAWGRA